MYSEQLEQLIRSVIADGVITEKERAVLHKKAAAEGIDESEIDVYVDGLVAQNNSKKSSEQSAKNQMNLNYVEKVLGDTILYKMKNYVKLDIKSKFLSRLYVNLVYVEQHKRTEDYPKGTIGILISGFMNKANDFREVYSIRNITIQTSHNSFSLKHDNYFEWGMGDFAVDGKKASFRKLFRIDKEILQQLCKASSFSISIPEIEYYYDSDRGETTSPVEQIEKAAALQYFASFAQVFYRSTIDNTAFPDAAIKRNEECEDLSGMFGLKDNDEIISLLGANVKGLQQIATDSPCYKEYRDASTPTTIIHIDSNKSLTGNNDGQMYHLDFHLHALKSEKGVPRFFLELGSTIPYKTNDEGKRKEEFPLELADGHLTISVGAKTYNIASVSNAEGILASQITKEDFEHNFFALDDEQVKSLVNATGFRLNVSGGNGISISARALLSDTIDMPKKWVLAYNLLTNPADKERLLQEYDDSKLSTKLIKGIKGLFGKK